MALERIGLGAVVTADTKPFVQGTDRARDSLGRFISQTNKVPPPLLSVSGIMSRITSQFKTMSAGIGRGMGMISNGLRNVAMGTAPLSAGLVAGFKAAGDFEQQMSIVGSVTRATQGEMDALSYEARRMGIVSQFSATEAGQGLEFLGRAGANTEQSIAALQGVMNAAAADGIGLAESADIVSTIVRSMGRGWSDAGHIADALALASSSANTNISLLGESFRYGAASAKGLNLSVEESMSLFAKLADAGTKGSMAGTAMTNMMNKLSKPTRKARKILKGWNIELENADGTLRKVSSIVEDFSNHLRRVKGDSTRNAIAMEVFGQRGVRAYNAIATAGAEATQELEQALIESSNGIGAAAEMAKRRMNNVWGAATLLKSSVESLFISLFKSLLGPFKESIVGFTDSLNSVLFLMMALEKTADGNIKGTKAWKDAVTLLGEDGASSALSVAQGFKDAAKSIREAWTWVTEKFKEVKSWLGDTFGDDGLRKLTKYVTLGFMIAAALAPVILGLATIKWAIGGLISVISGVATVISAAFWPITIVVGAVLLAYSMLKRENESFLDTAKRVWGDIKIWALDVWHNVLIPIYNGLKDVLGPAMEELGKVWSEVIIQVKLVFADLYAFLFGEMDNVKVDWRQAGQVIGAVIATIAEVILTFVKYAIPIIASIAKALYTVFSAVWKVISTIIVNITELVAKFAAGFREVFEGNLITGIKRIGMAVLDFVLTPLQLVTKAIVAAADAIPGIDAPDWLKTFAREGATGLVIGGTRGEQGRPTYNTREEMFADLRRQTGRGPKPPEMKAAASDVIGFDTAKIASEAASMASATKAKAAQPGETKVDLTLEDKREIDIKNEMCVDGEAMATATARHKQEIQDRAGFKATPYNRRMSLEHGAAPVRKTG